MKWSILWYLNNWIACMHCTQYILSLLVPWRISYFSIRAHVKSLTIKEMYSQTMHLSHEFILGIKMVRIDLCKNFTLKMPCRHQDSNQRPSKPDSYLLGSHSFLTGFGHFHGLAPQVASSLGDQAAVAWNTVPTFP